MLLLGLFCVATASVFATTYTPTILTDPPVTGGVNSANGVIIGGAGNGQVSLRSSVIAANATGGTNTITLGVGTYQLTIAGTGETASSGDATIGDLDVLATTTSGTRNTLTVQGAGAGSTTIQQTSSIDRIFDLHPINVAGSITFILTDVTAKGGNLTSGSGGAILAGRAGDVTTLTNCTFDGNTAPSNGGAISQSSSLVSHDLNITNCVFMNNTATGAVGGAVSYNGIGTVTIARTLFSNNIAGTQGGAVNVSGSGSGGTYNISTSTFVGNTANGTTFGGAAIAIVNGVALNVTFNRFAGNTAGGVANGKTISTGGGTVTTFDVNRNWWGRNTGPLATDVLGTAPTVWLQLRNSASPTTVNAGSGSTVSADIFGLNTGGATASSNLTGLAAFPSSGTVFGNVQRGTIPGGTIQFINGAATVVFTATTAGAGGVDAVADSQTINAPIAVNGPPVVSNRSASVNEDGVFTFSAATFDAGFSDPNAGDILQTVRVTSLPASGLLKLSGSTFTVPQDIARATLGNLTYTPTANYNGADSFGWNGSDGTLFATTGAAVNVTVNAVNDKPTFTAANPPAVNEDPGAQTVVGWVTNFNPGPNESGQTALAYTVSNVSNPGLFSAGPSIATNGNLSYTLAANANGNSTFQVTVQDSGGTPGIDTSDPQTFTITVNAVNDKPTFTAANPPAVNEDPGAQTVIGWVTNVNPGANEAGQTVVAYTVSNVSNATLFSAGPAVAANGNLSYTPATNANGTSTFDVRVQDSGGAPGIDLSDAQTFTITVNAVNDNPAPGTDTLVRYPSQPVKVRITTLLSNDTDPELNSLSLTAVSAALPAGAVVTQDGSWVYYTPPTGSTSAGSFTYTINDGQGGTANGTVNVNIIVDNSTAQNITKIETLGDGSKRLTFGGIPGRSYRVQSTDSLTPATWVDRTTVVADAQGKLQFTDPIPLPPTRFYRSVSP